MNYQPQFELFYDHCFRLPKQAEVDSSKYFLLKIYQAEGAYTVCMYRVPKNDSRKRKMFFCIATWGDINEILQAYVSANMPVRVALPIGSHIQQHVEPSGYLYESLHTVPKSRFCCACSNFRYVRSLYDRIN